MAAEQLSTAIKEEWSLTDEEVALIEASTTLSDKPDDVGTLAAEAVDFKSNTSTIFVPTPTLLGKAQRNVAQSGIPLPSKSEVHGGAIHPGLTGKEFLRELSKLFTYFQENQDLGPTARRLVPLVKRFLIGCISNPCADAFEVWDVFSRDRKVLHLGKDGDAPTPREPENFVLGHNDTYGQIQMALVYFPQRRKFVCAYAFAHRPKDAMKTPWTEDLTNSIRILFADLMAHNIQDRIPTLFNLVESDKPYPVLGGNGIWTRSRPI
jgi:hypothetical protein